MKLGIFSGKILSVSTLQNKTIIVFGFLCLFFTVYPYDIVLVKQVVYANLYCCSNQAPVNELIFSSFAHPGPVGLFTKYNADFFIVDTEADQECQVWKEKVFYSGHKSLQFFEDHRRKIIHNGIRAQHQWPQGHFMTTADAIDWSDYDIVISIDIAIPACITKKYPKTLWAYYISEGSMPSYKKSFSQPVNGYDVFLTQDFYANRKLAKHVVEFPFQLQYYGCFHELFDTNPEPQIRNGFQLETHTHATLTKQQKSIIGKIAPLLPRAGGTLKQMITSLMQTKYYIVYLDPHSQSRKNIRGNALVEAIATGNLVIARNFGLMNKDVLTERTRVNTFNQLLERIIFFENNPEEYKKELALQQARLDYLCFERPMDQLIKKWEQKRKRVS